MRAISTHQIGFVSLAVAVALLGTSPTFAQPVSAVSDAEADWVRCVQAIRDLNGRPPSSGIFGPRFEVNAARFQCKQHWDATRAAIEAEERAAGTQPSKNVLNERFDEAKHRVAAALVELRGRLDPKGLAANQPIGCKASVKEGLSAYNRGDYERALCHWLTKANAGNAVAQNNMGILFAIGLTTRTPKDDDRAAEWYLLAARQGLVVAMHNLADAQSRLGYLDAAQSWRAQAAAASQRSAVIEQQNAVLLGQVLGCAIGGGCATTGATTSYLPSRPRPVLPAPTPPPPQVECKLSPYAKDIWGNPRVTCHNQ